MSDNDNPEQPKPPFTPDPNKNPFDRPRSELRSFANPEPNTGSQDQAPATDQETLFRAAAIKCAQMEEELIQILIEKSEREGSASMVENEYGFLAFHIRTDKFMGVEGGEKAMRGVTFDHFLDARKDEIADSLGVDTNTRLKVYVHSDEESRDAFVSYSRGNSLLKAYVYTAYFFNTKGEYAKIVRLPNEIAEKSRQELSYPSGVGNFYESKMTPGDFELAGQALQTLIDIARPQEEQVTDSGSS